jgi:hypothetical protein
MDGEQVAALRALLAPTGWLDRATEFARAMRRSTRHAGGVLLVGPPEREPWHFAAHLDQQSRLAGIPELAPTLIRWAPPAQAPAHLRVGIQRLETARRGESVVVVTERGAPGALLERVHDARRLGATILSLGDDPDLAAMAHEALVISPQAAPVSLDGAQHLVSAAATQNGDRRGMRSALARVLDVVSGPVSS